eukprot:CAMPEP_0181381040 /NCGR_PEP_ID=MMETSP1106-20121128/19897_1 /TAXON_ID=81844 /ORGANISM="Mantoniella antarctica, Strain SL-175" /LENGTH=282 /DNA_ID=CAMNT_0023500173 /DNA_START=148 /DNA_END=992 /DNA_ORIENTATION=+
MLTGVLTKSIVVPVGAGPCRPVVHCASSLIASPHDAWAGRNRRAVGTCQRQATLGASRRGRAASTPRGRSARAGPPSDGNGGGGGGDGGAEGMGGEGGEMKDTNVLYERMKALQEKEAAETSALVDAAVEQDQAVVAGIRGDAAERQTPAVGDFPALIEHLLSTPMEAMENEGVRCGPLLTKVFQAHIAAQMRRASATGPMGDEVVAELQALEVWVHEAREKQADRDDAMRRRTQSAERRANPVEDNQEERDVSGTRAPAPEYPTPVMTVSDKFRILMTAAG